MSLSNIIADGALIGMSGALLWHFSNIWRYGQYLIQEPSIVILVLETGGLLLIFIFGVSKFIAGIKRGKGK